jgi:hypothetical protein
LVGTPSSFRAYTHDRRIIETFDNVIKHEIAEADEVWKEIAQRAQE